MKDKATPVNKKGPNRDRSDESEGPGINREWCKGCGICVFFCPTGALALDEAGKAIIKELGQCNHCGLCELRCPDIAIEFVIKSHG